jgi:oligosaccharyltransferase complex subunit gamma
VWIRGHKSAAASDLLPLNYYHVKMKLLTLLALPLALVAAKKESDRFTKSLSKGLPLKLTDSSFTSLTKAPRDYSIAVLLTAIEPRFGCQACQDFQPDWEILGKSWQKGDKKGESRLLLGTLDFLDGKQTFQQLGLQHAPVLMLFQPTTGPGAAKAGAEVIRYDFTAG